MAQQGIQVRRAAPAGAAAVALLCVFFGKCAPAMFRGESEGGLVTRERRQDLSRRSHGG